MNFLRALPCFGLFVSLNAQVIDLKPKGGGDLRIGEIHYRFELADLSSAPPKGGLPGAVKLEGQLFPQNGGRPFHMALTVLKDGSLYLLYIERRTPNAYPDSWSPSLNARLRARTRALKLEDRPGGRIELQCEGFLTGIIAKRPQEANWSGTIWATFPGD
jgi:hypothetical protein